MITTNILPRPISMLLSRIIAALSVVLSLLIVGNPENFKTYVAEPVTTETRQITVIGENKTWNTIGDPRVGSIEKKQGDEWVTVGAYDCFTDDYSIYYAFSTFKHTVNFSSMGMSDTLSPGEYRVVIGFSLENRESSSHTAYAYFTVEE